MQSEIKVLSAYSSYCYSYCMRYVFQVDVDENGYIESRMYDEFIELTGP